MKEILLPYVILCMILFKFNIIKTTARNVFTAILLGLIISALLFFTHRLWSPVDLTNSTQIRAPHTVLTPAFMQHIDQIHVTHNQDVKKGDLLYTLRDETQEAQHRDAVIQLEQAERKLEMYTNMDTNLGRISNIPQETIRELRDGVERLKANVSALSYLLERNQVTAPHDGMVTHVYIGEGTRVGSLHLWDTGKKFVEMRIPDQSYQYIKIGQFAEFFVDAYPGEIFRARVHSIVKATGESQGMLLPQEQNVRGHIGLGQLPVGRTVLLEYHEPNGYNLPIGATGSAWISANKPAVWLGFLDIIGGATLRLAAVKSYINSL